MCCNTFVSEMYCVSMYATTAIYMSCFTHLANVFVFLAKYVIKIKKRWPLIFKFILLFIDVRNRSTVFWLFLVH